MTENRTEENIKSSKPMPSAESMAPHQKVKRFHITLLLLPVLCCLLQQTIAQNNIALGKPAQQVNNWRTDRGHAPVVVDGINSGVFGHFSCSHTAGDSSWQWWSVDLQAIHVIKSVRITNRNDCCHNNLRNFALEVSVEDPTTLPGYPGPTNASVCFTLAGTVPIPGPIGYACDESVTGRYVRLIKLGRGPLVICELEVFETNILIEKPNLAEGKPAMQSTTLTPYDASFAVDGNQKAYLTDGTCSHTDASNLMHWWMVDLEDMYLIESISITNCINVQPETLSNFVVEISVETPDTLEGFPDKTASPVCLNQIEAVPVPGSILFSCERPLLGRYVRVVKRETEIGRPITICDFEVFGEVPKHWRFENTARQGARLAQSSNADGSQLLHCAHLALRDKVTRMTTPFFQVDISTGFCRLLQSNVDASNTTSSNWVLYKLG